MAVKDNVYRILQELPLGVELVAAIKGRSTADVKEAIAAGIKIVGENYVQETETAYSEIGSRVSWHFIGHLQKNKVKKAVYLFDVIETVDSVELAGEINKCAGNARKMMPVLIEINCDRESQKSGVFPEKADELVRGISAFPNLRVQGLMTMGSAGATENQLKTCFSETRALFEKLKSINLPNIEMRYLSMGMSDSYRIAIQEGANIVRIGRLLFQ